MRAIRPSIVIALVALLVGSPLGAEEDVAVPVPLQLQLLAKVAAYDKNFAARAGDRARILIVKKPGDAASSRIAQQAERAADGLEIGDLDVEAEVTDYPGGPALAEAVKARRVAIVYAATGFSEGDLEAIAAAFDGGDVMSVGAVAKFVPRGVVLGFDLVSGKPKLVVHLGRAKRQNVQLSSRVLKLMKVVE